MKMIRIKFWKNIYLSADKLKDEKLLKLNTKDKFYIHITTGFISVMLGFIFMNKFYIGRIIFAFIFLHELCHLFCFLTFGCDIREVILNPFGISMVYPFTMCQSYIKDIICYLSAPIFNLCIAYYLKVNFPPTFYVRIIIAVNFLIGIFNLLPIGDLDGGQIIKAFLLLHFTPYTSELFCFVVSIVLLIPLSLGSLIIFFRTRNPTAVITCVFLLIKILSSEYTDV